jgi:catechol 2,3-dioxygenase-like lactoylglutathione lyase family enzyme
MIQIAALDHLVLTVADISRTREFYQAVLGMVAVTFGGDRQALCYGQQKNNLHQAGAAFAPTPWHPHPARQICAFSLPAP